MNKLNKGSAPRIALLGLFGGENIGNEASLDCMVFFLRKQIPSAQISCICSIPEAAARRHRVRAVGLSPPRFGSIFARGINRLLLRVPTRLAQFGSALQEMKSTDFVIVPGTGALDDFGWSPFRYPLDFALWCVAAKLCRVKLLFVSVGAGPIANTVSRLFLNTAARCATYCSYRDLTSRNYMASIGVERSTDKIYPDLVFAAPVPPRVTAQTTTPLRVSLGLMTYYGWSGDRKKGAGIQAAYLSKMASFANWLLKQGYEVRLIVGERSDDVAVDAVVQKLTASGRRCYPGQLAAERIENFNDLFEAVAATDFVVATRFHNVVCALMACKPVISIGYAAKNEALMAEMGLRDYCQRVDDLDLEQLKRQFEQGLVKRAEIEAMLGIQTRNIRAQLEDQQEVLQNILLGIPEKSPAAGNLRLAPSGVDAID